LDPNHQVLPSNGNVARAEAICAAHASQGCKIDSNSTITGGPMSQRKQDGMNDVAFSNWRGDYANFIAQIGTADTVSGLQVQQLTQIHTITDCSLPLSALGS
jgi:hypothetical protein